MPYGESRKCAIRHRQQIGVWHIFRRQRVGLPENQADNQEGAWAGLCNLALIALNPKIIIADVPDPATIAFRPMIKHPVNMAADQTRRGSG
jgi:hypothetical protein